MLRLSRIPSGALLAAGLLTSPVLAQNPDSRASGGKAAVVATAPKSVRPPGGKPGASEPAAPDAAVSREERLKIDRLTLEKLRIDTELEIKALKSRIAREADDTGAPARRRGRPARLESLPRRRAR